MVQEENYLRSAGRYEKGFRRPISKSSLEIGGLVCGHSLFRVISFRFILSLQGLVSGQVQSFRGIFSAL